MLFLISLSLHHTHLSASETLFHLHLSCFIVLHKTDRKHSLLSCGLFSRPAEHNLPSLWGTALLCINKIVNTEFLLRFVMFNPLYSLNLEPVFGGNQGT